jgi:tRNA(Ile)-lysidine synthase
MHQFVRNLLTEWRSLHLPFAGETVIVAVSGGADSVSLLLAMHDLQKRKKMEHRIVAAHFNHRLRGAESDGDEEFVRDLTTRLGGELAIGHGAVSTDGNLEQNARVARYGFLRQTAANLHAFAVATGHTTNDQAETVLLNLVRGSGPEGLSGMKAIRILSDPSEKSEERVYGDEDLAGHISGPAKTLLVRPLLSWAKRIHTEGYCHDSAIEYRYDTMNEDTAFRRVRIRKILLPLLEDMNPKIIETLANTASLMQGLIEKNAPRDPSRTSDELSLSDLRSLSPSDLFDTIRPWLHHRRGTTRQLQLKHIKAVERLVLSPKSGRTAELPGGKVIKSAGKLVYKENKVEN